MSRAVLSLGSNLGDRVAALNAALAGLAAADVRIVAVSPMYETEPIGGPEQPDYLNAVAVVETDRSPYDLLEVAQGVEAALGRVRVERWGPRTVDIDIVVYDDLVSDDPRLTLPHALVAERAFVLTPWRDVEPAAALPDGRTVESMLAQLETDGVRLRDDIVLQLPG
ncbi:MAG: 2-amino-4-hydroxy-6-hydroxymethyldihydropteridine diphosphokinase [Actinomycetota bacterium]